MADSSFESTPKSQDTRISNKVWGVFTGYTLVYLAHDKANADFMKDLVEKEHKKQQNRNKVYVKELWTDCFVGKLKDGWQSYLITMKKNGTIVSVVNAGILPSVTHGYFGKSISPITQEIRVRVLAADEREAKKKADEIRLNSLMDDQWDPNYFNNRYK